MSQYPFHTLKESGWEESESSNLLVQAWYIRQEVAWAYNYLPLGLKVLENIKRIVRKHLEAMGSFEIQMTALWAREHWETTGRDSMDILFKVHFSDGKHNFLNPTHEELVTPLLKEFIKSYKDLPVSVFQIQTKFRNEKRAKSGILRGREFLMKDMYSFHKSLDDLDVYYEKAIAAYRAIFKELGLGNDTYLTYSSGGTFSKSERILNKIIEKKTNKRRSRYWSLIYIILKECVFWYIPFFYNQKNPTCSWDLLGQI